MRELRKTPTNDESLIGAVRGRSQRCMRTSSYHIRITSDLACVCEYVTGGAAIVSVLILAKKVGVDGLSYGGFFNSPRNLVGNTLYCTKWPPTLDLPEAKPIDALLPHNNLHLHHRLSKWDQRQSHRPMGAAMVRTDPDRTMGATG